MSDFVVRGLG